ncbi:MAG: ParB N-terminal domain-containing protein [Kofleriaceae bacterium]
MGTDLKDLVEKLVARVAELPRDERVEALNTIRQALHRVSPFAAEPVDCVLWVRSDEVTANDYNPNSVAPPEMDLLRRSIEADGYTQPIVTCPIVDEGAEVNVVADGFHRNRVGKEVPEIRARVHGYLPIVRVRSERRERHDLIATTIRHNRARGKHGVHAMSAIVADLHRLGWKDEQIMAELGMERDEVLRLKQVTGLAALFADREFSKAWEPVKGPA